MYERRAAAKEEPCELRVLSVCGARIRASAMNEARAKDAVEVEVDASRMRRDGVGFCYTREVRGETGRSRRRAGRSSSER